jgi:hypothetical protein
VDDLTVRRGIAVDRERAVLRRIAPVMSALKSLVVSEFDASAPELRSWGTSRGAG